jgi:hypothetical protein
MLLYPGEEFLDVEGLAESSEDTRVMLRSRCVPVSGDDEDRKLGSVRMALEPVKELQSIHLRHEQVQQDEAGTVQVLELGEGVQSVDSLDDCPSCALEDVSDALSDVRIILHQKDGLVFGKSGHGVR